MNLCVVAASVKAKTNNDRDVKIARRLGRASLVLSVVGIVSGVAIFTVYVIIICPDGLYYWSWACYN